MSTKYICPYCFPDTGGNHQVGCPNRPFTTVSKGFPQEHTCPDCTRLKALLKDVWEQYLKSRIPPYFDREVDILHNELEARLKKEGIE